MGAAADVAVGVVGLIIPAFEVGFGLLEAGVDQDVAQLRAVSEAPVIGEGF